MPLTAAQHEKMPSYVPRQRFPFNATMRRYILNYMPPIIPPYTEDTETTPYDPRLDDSETVRTLALFDLLLAEEEGHSTIWDTADAESDCETCSEPDVAGDHPVEGDCVEPTSLEHTSHSSHSTHPGHSRDGSSSSRPSIQSDQDPACHPRAEEFLVDEDTSINDSPELLAHEEMELLKFHLIFGSSRADSN